MMTRTSSSGSLNDGANHVGTIRAWTASLEHDLSNQDAVITSGALIDLRSKVMLLFGEGDPYPGSTCGSRYPKDDRPDVVAVLMRKAWTKW